MNRIVFDINHTGHHFEYILHLIKYIENDSRNNKYYFIIHEKFLEVYLTKSKNITLIPVTQNFIDNNLRTNLYYRSVDLFNLLEGYCKKFKVTHVVLLYFNLFQFSLIFKRSFFTIDGIFFKPPYRINRSPFSLKFVRSMFSLFLISLNRSIKRIYILNDINAVKYFNRVLRTNKFLFLPDPIPSIKEFDTFDIYKYFKIPIDRKIYLHIGSINGRKGSIEVLESIKLLPLEVRDSIFILFVGKSDEITKNKIDNLIGADVPSNIFYHLNKFVDPSLFRSIIRASHCVLLPYKNPESSSGILGHSAITNTMVITTGSGLIKEFVQNYKLGFLLNSTSPEDIAFAIINSYMVTNFSNCFLPAKNLFEPYKFASKIIS